MGGRASGKSSVLRTLAQLVGQKLVEFPMNSDTDTTELLGGFQQVSFVFYSTVTCCCNVLSRIRARCLIDVDVDMIFLKSMVVPCRHLLASIVYNIDTFLVYTLSFLHSILNVLCCWSYA